MERMENALSLEDDLLRVIAEPNEEFEARGKSYHDRHLYHFLGLEKDDLPKVNHSLTLLGFHRLYRPLSDGGVYDDRLWLCRPRQQVSYMRTLLNDASLVCKVCKGKSLNGSMQAKASSVVDHSAGQKHKLYVLAASSALAASKATTAAKAPHPLARAPLSASAAAESSRSGAAEAEERDGGFLDDDAVETEDGVLPRPSAFLVQGDLGRFYSRVGAPPPPKHMAAAFAAGLAVSEGVPYSAVPRVFSETAIGLVNEMSSGVGRSRALREVHLPEVAVRQQLEGWEVGQRGWMRLVRLGQQQKALAIAAVALVE